MLDPVTGWLSHVDQLLVLAANISVSLAKISGSAVFRARLRAERAANCLRKFRREVGAPCCFRVSGWPDAGQGRAARTPAPRPSRPPARLPTTASGKRMHEGQLAAGLVIYDNVLYHML